MTSSGSGTATAGSTSSFSYTEQAALDSNGAWQNSPGASSVGTYTGGGTTTSYTFCADGQWLPVGGGAAVNSLAGLATASWPALVDAVWGMGFTADSAAKTPFAVGNVAGAATTFTSEKMKGADGIFGSNNVAPVVPVTDAALLVDYGLNGVSAATAGADADVAGGPMDGADAQPAPTGGGSGGSTPRAGTGATASLIEPTSGSGAQSAGGDEFLIEEHLEKLRGRPHMSNGFLGDPQAMQGAQGSGVSSSIRGRLTSRPIVGAGGSFFQSRFLRFPSRFFVTARITRFLFLPDEAARDWLVGQRRQPRLDAQIRLGKLAAPTDAEIAAYVADWQAAFRAFSRTPRKAFKNRRRRQSERQDRGADGATNAVNSELRECERYLTAAVDGVVRADAAADAAEMARKRLRPRRCDFTRRRNPRKPRRSRLT